MSDVNTAPEVAPTRAQTLPTEAESIMLAQQTMAKAMNKELEAPKELNSVKNAVEKVPEQPKPTQPEENPHVALSKQQRVILQQQREIKAQNARIAQIEARFAAQVAQATQQPMEESIPLSRLKANALDELKKVGITYQHLTDSMLSGKPIPTDVQIADVKQEINNLRMQAEADKKAAAEAAVKAQEAQTAAQINEYMDGVKTYIDANPDKYELIRLNDKQNDVLEVQDIYYTRTGKVLSMEEACTLVEDYLGETVLPKWEQSAKLKAKIGQVTQPKQGAKSTAPQEPRTLNNQMTQQSYNTPNQAFPTPEEAIKNALAKLGRTA